MKPFCRDTWVEVDLDAVRSNVQAIRQHIPEKTGIIAVVKADGYGHGSVQVGREALAAGADCLAVAMLDEAIVLRKAGITAPILVLGYTPLDSVEQAFSLDVELTAYQLEWINEADRVLAKIGGGDRKLGIHVKVDTGMGRLGIRSSRELIEIAGALQQASSLKWNGLFTHFACADEEDTTHVLGQHERFQAILRDLTEQGFALPNVHCCNTAAAIAFPDWGYDMIRLGIGLYGLYPSMYLKEQAQVKLTPALSLKTRITHTRNAEEPMTVSYGATYTAKVGEQVATLPIGYADGFSRLLSNRGSALHAGRRVSIIGKVCMDQSMVRIDANDAQVGDEVVLYGRQGSEEISLDEVAGLLGTINYEVSCMLNYRVPRVYLRGGKVVETCHKLMTKC